MRFGKSFVTLELNLADIIFILFNILTTILTNLCENMTII